MYSSVPSDLSRPMSFGLAATLSFGFLMPATRFASSIPSNGRVYAITTLGYPTTRPVFGWRRIKGLLGSFGLDESVGDVAGSVAASPNFNSNVALRSTNIFDDTRRLEGFGDTK